MLSIKCGDSRLKISIQIFCCISVCVFVCSFTYRSLMCSSVLLAADWLEPDITVLINCINALWSSCERIRQILLTDRRQFRKVSCSGFEETANLQTKHQYFNPSDQCCSNASLYFHVFTASHYWAAGERRVRRNTFWAEHRQTLHIRADCGEWTEMGVVGSEGNVSKWNVRRRVQSKGKLRIELITVVWDLFNAWKWLRVEGSNP